MKLNVSEPLKGETKYSPSYIYRQIFGPCMKGNFQKWPNINLELLHRLNSDTVGWIHMDGSPINYPIVKAHRSKPDYYLEHNFSKEESYHGSIIMDSSHNGVFGAYTTLFLGHHMKDGSMFFSISKLFSPDYYNNHKSIDFIMDDGIYSADFFAVHYINSNDVEPVRTSFLSEEDYASWLDNRMKQALYPTLIVPSIKDRVIIFKTCVFPEDPNDWRNSIAAYAILHSKQDELKQELPILVNAHNSIDDDYKLDLVDIEDSKIDKKCYPYLKNMLHDCRFAGGYPNIVSAYRSFEEQEYIFNHEVEFIMDELNIDRRLASGMAAWRCAIPGTSEHELGLAIDISEIENPLSANSSFTSNWLENNAWRYGFILRYPKDKVDITGTQYEPWHYRFVGRMHSEKMYQLGITLEEYIDSMNNTQ